MQYLIYFGLFEQAETLLRLLEKFAEESNIKVKNIRQADFEKEHPELAEIYPDLTDYKEIQKLDANLFEKYSFMHK
jgi:hypothetical protein